MRILECVGCFVLGAFSMRLLIFWAEWKFWNHGGRP